MASAIINVERAWMKDTWTAQASNNINAATFKVYVLEKSRGNCSRRHSD